MHNFVHVRKRRRQSSIFFYSLKITYILQCSKRGGCAFEFSVEKFVSYFAQRRKRALISLIHI